MKFFKRAKKIINGLYQDIFKYIYFVPCDLSPMVDIQNAWYLDNRVIPHAMGAICNESYTNSKEALENSIEHNVKILEADVCITFDDIPVLAHEIEKNITFDDFMNSKIKDKFCPLSLEQLIEYMEKDAELFIFLDSKGGEILRVVEWLVKYSNHLIDRFVIQVRTVKDYIAVCNVHKFKYFHWNFSIDRNVNQHLGFVVRNKIHTCSVPHNLVKNEKTLRYLNKFNVKAYAYTVNTKQSAEELYKKGVWGIISDELFN